MSASSYRFWPWVLAGLMLLISAGALYRLATGAPQGLDTARFYEEWRFALAADPSLVVGSPLTTQRGEPFAPERFRGHWNFVYFGYSHCPDICVPTLQRMERIAVRLRETDTGKWDPVRWVMVSVDPARDTPARLDAYLGQVAPSVLGLTAPQRVLNPLALQFDVAYAREEIHPMAKGGQGDDPHAAHRAIMELPGLSESAYNVGHSGDVFLIDPQGRLRGRFPPPQTVDKVHAAFLAIAHATRVKSGARGFERTR